MPVLTCQGAEGWELGESFEGQLAWLLIAFVGLLSLDLQGMNLQHLLVGAQWL